MKSDQEQLEERYKLNVRAPVELLLGVNAETLLYLMADAATAAFNSR